MPSFAPSPPSLPPRPTSLAHFGMCDVCRTLYELDVWQNIIIIIKILLSGWTVRRQHIFFSHLGLERDSGAGIAQSVVSWASCLAWCSVVGSILLWASGRGDFTMGVNMGSDSTSPPTLTPHPPPPPPFTPSPSPTNSFGWEYRPRSSLCTHAFHRTVSKDPHIRVLDRWMPATEKIKTCPACAIHEDGMWLPLWLD